MCNKPGGRPLYLLSGHPGLQDYGADAFCQKYQVDSRPFILPRGDALVFFKGTDKITQVVETVPVGDLRDRIVGGG